MTSFLDSLRDGPSYSERSVPPPTVPGRDPPIDPSSPFCGLRKRQLLDACRGFDLFTPDLENLTVAHLISRMDGWHRENKFSGKPVNPYYAERAKFSPDEITAAIHGDGWFERKSGRGITQSGYCGMFTGHAPWEGPDPDAPVMARAAPAAKPAKAKAAPADGSPSMAELRGKARELGISTFGKSRRDVMASIVQAEGARGAAPEPPEAA